MTHYKVTVDNTSRIQSQKNLHRLEPVIQYIQSHYTEAISLENAASLAHLNPEYFCRFFGGTWEPPSLPISTACV